MLQINLRLRPLGLFYPFFEKNNSLRLTGKNKKYKISALEDDMEHFIRKTVLASAIALTLTSGALASNLKNVYVNTYTNEEEIRSSISTLNNNLANDDSKTYLTSDQALVDTLTGGVLIAENNGLHLYGSDIKEDLSKVCVIGGEDSISNELVGEEKIEKRIAGADRYETAIKIAEELGTDRDIIIASGEVFADALPATSLATKEDANIILVKADEVPEATKEYLKAFAGDKDIIIVGGNNTISVEVEEEIKALVANSDLERIAGKDRYETSEKLAEKFDENTGKVLVGGEITEKTFLSAVFAGKQSYPLVLVNEDKDIDLSSIFTDNTENVYVFTKADVNFTNKDSAEFKIMDLKGSQIDVSHLLGEEVEASGQTDQVSEPKQEANTDNFAGENITILDNGDVINHDRSIIKFANGEVRSFTAVHNMNTTAYSLFPGSTGLTASGTPARHGAVAVDPSVIPLGTELYVQSTDDWPSYGKAVAEDTGSAIKGNKLDVFYDSHQTAVNFGRRPTFVYVLGE